MASPAARDQFLRQMEQIVEGIKQSRMKVRWLLLYKAGFILVMEKSSPGKNRLLLVVRGGVLSILRTHLHVSAGAVPAPRASCTAGPQAAPSNSSHS